MAGHGTTTFNNCINYGTIATKESTKGSSIGGITANNGGCEYNFCANYGIINAGNILFVGGIVGTCASEITTISQCANIKDISGNNNVSGICGRVIDNEKVTITNCYNSGNINGKLSSGLCSVEGGTVELTNCYNVGTITGNNANATCSVNDSSLNQNITVKNVYYLDSSCTNGNGESKSSEQLKNDVLANFGEDIWTHDANNNYPILKWQK